MLLLCTIILQYSKETTQITTTQVSSLNGKFLLQSGTNSSLENGRQIQNHHLQTGKILPLPIAFDVLQININEIVEL